VHRAVKTIVYRPKDDMGVPNSRTIGTVCGQWSVNALGAPNNLNPWTENSPQRHYLSVHVDGK